MNNVRAAFFDRDGTIIKDANYLASFDKIELIKPVIEVCKTFQAAGYKMIVVTNQSGVARGFFDEKFVCDTHDLLKKIFAGEGVLWDAFYYCPHHPNGVIKEYSFECNCRKPAPGMLLQAAKDFDIDLSKSVMIGDKDLDLQAGYLAGCKSFDINKLINLSNIELLNIVKHLD